MLKENSLVSIVMPTYNSDKFIKQSIESVLSQSFRDWELLVVDDGSRDSTRDIVRAFTDNDERIRVLENETNSGPAAARNRGIEAAKGEYIAFLDSDDLWEPEKLTQHIAFMESESAAFSFTPYRVISADRDYIRDVDVLTPDRVSLEDMLKKRATLGCSTVIVRRELVGNTRFPLLMRGQDYALWLLLLRKCAEAVKFPKPLTRYRINPAGISRNKIRKSLYQWRVYRDVMNISTGESLYLMLFYAKNAIFRK